MTKKFLSLKAVFHCLLALTWLAGSSEKLHAQGQDFRAAIGNPPIGPVAKGNTLQLPYITWGGDVATFHANGCLLYTSPSPRD